MLTDEFEDDIDSDELDIVSMSEYASDLLGYGTDLGSYIDDEYDMLLDNADYDGPEFDCD